MKFNGTKKELLVKLKLANLDENKKYDLTIENEKKKRSLNANAYMWSLIHEIALKLNYSDVEIYQNYIKEQGIYKDITLENKAVATIEKSWSDKGLGWVSEKVDNYNEDFSIIRLYYGTSVYNSTQMNRILNQVVEDCKALEIPTKEELELKRLIEQWESNYERKS